MKQFISLFLISISLYAQCEHIKPAEIEYLGVQTAETVQNDSLNCIIFTRQAERFVCPKCSIEVNLESRKDTVVFWRKEE